MAEFYIRNLKEQYLSTLLILKKKKNPASKSCPKKIF